MRWSVGVFGLLCGAVVVGVAAYFGFSTTDDPTARWLVAFICGAISAAGLGGHAVALRLWRINRIWSFIVGLVAVALLIISLSNSLGVLATRSSKMVAETTTKNQAINDDKEELARLEKALAALGNSTPTDEAAVAGARRAADTATERRKVECGANYEKRGPHCKDREEDETKAAEALARATAAKATTDKAAKIEAGMAPIRERLRKSGATEATNVQAVAIVTLFHIPTTEADFVATMQQTAMAVALELIVVLCMVTFELLRPERVMSAARAPAPITASQDAPRVASKPRLVSSQPAAFSVIGFGAAELEAQPGSELDFDAFFRAYSAAARNAKLRAVSPEEFVAPFQRLCDEAGIRTRKRGSKLFLMDVALRGAVETKSAPA